MKIFVILLINAFVLVRTENETSSIPPPNTTELTTAAIINSTTAILTDISTPLTTITTIPSNTAENITIPKETSSTSPPTNNTDPTTAINTPAITAPESKPQKPQQELASASPPTNTTVPATTSTLATTAETKPLPETASTSAPSINVEQPTTLAVNTSKPEDWTDTQILSKKNVNLQDHADKSVQIAVPEDGDFLSFIRQSSLWADKSLLIPKICGIWKDKVTSETVKLQRSVMFATAPPKWGKTINLSMLKFYFELPTNSDGFPLPKEQSASYRYFKEGKVVLEDGSVQELDGIPLVSEHDSRDLANHPVIYIKGANFTGDMDSFRVMIHQTYQRHEGLLKRLKAKRENVPVNSTDHKTASEDLQDFLMFYDWNKIKNECPEYKLQFSMEILSKLLSQTYESPAVILYDDYDYYIYNTFFNLDHFNLSICTNNFSDFFENFMSNTYKFNEFRTTAVISGVVRANFPSTFAIFDNYHRSYVDFVSLFPFYGIFQHEFDRMVEKRGIDREVADNATQWYGGYRSLGYLNTQMFSTHSVTRFISTLQIRDYWPKTRLIGQFMKELLQKPELQTDIQNFTQSWDGNQISCGIHYSRFRKLSLEDYAVVRKLQLGLMKYYPEKAQHEYVHVRHRDLVFALMVSEGYAAVHANQTRGKLYGVPDYIHVTLPNREIYNQFSFLRNTTA